MWLLSVCSQFCLFTLLFSLFDYSTRSHSVCIMKGPRTMCCANPPLIPIENSHRLAPYWERDPWRSSSSSLPLHSLNVFYGTISGYVFVPSFSIFRSLVHYQNVATTTMIILVPFHTHTENFVFGRRPDEMMNGPRPERTQRNSKGKERRQTQIWPFFIHRKYFFKKRFRSNNKNSNSPRYFHEWIPFSTTKRFPIHRKPRENEDLIRNGMGIDSKDSPFVCIQGFACTMHPEHRLGNFFTTFSALCSAIQKGYVCEKKVTIKQFCCGSYFPIGWSLLLLCADRYRCNIYLCRRIHWFRIEGDTRSLTHETFGWEIRVKSLWF